jgi:hypothetical protein
MVDLRLAPTRGRHPARPVGTIDVRVASPYAASIAVTAPAEQQIGRPVPLTLVVDNIGSVDWRTMPEPQDAAGEPIAGTPIAASPAMLTLVWRSPIRPDAEATSVPVALAPGQRLAVNLLVTTPPSTGIWRLEAIVGHPILGPMPDIHDAMVPTPVSFIDAAAAPAG